LIFLYELEQHEPQLLMNCSLCSPMYYL